MRLFQLHGVAPGCPRVVFVLGKAQGKAQPQKGTQAFRHRGMYVSASCVDFAESRAYHELLILIPI